MHIQQKGHNVITGLVYLSEATTFFDELDLNCLLINAANTNQKHSITGFLYFKNGQFVQYIEGPANELDELFLKIKSDKRHRVITVIDQIALDDRLFPEWSMAYFASPDDSDSLGGQIFLNMTRFISDYDMTQGAKKSALINLLGTVKQLNHS